MGLLYLFLIPRECSWLMVFLPALLSYVILLQLYYNTNPYIGNIERIDSTVMNQLFPMSSDENSTPFSILNNSSKKKTKKRKRKKQAKQLQMEVIATGLDWCEGPLWIEDQEDILRSYLLFSEVKKNRIWRWEEGTGMFTIGKSIFLQRSGCRSSSNGNTVRAVSCTKNNNEENVSGKISTFNKDGLSTFFTALSSLVYNLLPCNIKFSLPSSSQRYKDDFCDNLIEPGSNGLVEEPHTRLLVMCEHGERQVSRIESDGSRTVLAKYYDGKRLNSPNDLIYLPNGDLLFTDPPYGLNGKEDDPQRELNFSGVFRAKAASLANLPKGSTDGVQDLEVIESKIKRPNGIALAPVGNKVYIANSDKENPLWLEIELSFDNQNKSSNDSDENRSIAQEEDKNCQNPTTGLTEENVINNELPISSIVKSRKIFRSADDLTKNGTRVGNPDGLKVSSSGYLFASGPGGIIIMNPKGDVVGTLLTQKKTSNISIGKSGYLYITADDLILRLKTNAKPTEFTFAHP